MPRRPLSAYNLFFKERREAMMKAATAAEDQQRTPTFGRRKSNKSVGIGFANLARTIASEWKTLDPTTKAPYEARAAAEKSRYDKEMLVWRAKQKQEKAAAAAAAPKVESEKISSSSSAFNVPQVKTSQASGRDSDLQGASFQASMPASSGMQDSSSMMHSMQLPFPTASMMDEMMMMSQQYPYQQQRQGMMGWTGLHSPISSSSNTGRPSVVSRSSAVQMAELSNEAVRTVSGSQPQGFMHEHMNPSLAHGRHQLMWEQSRSMASGDGQSDILARDSSNITAASPAMFEEFQQQQSHFFPGPAHSNGERVPMSASLSRGVNPHRQGQTMEQAGAFAERRNTWSGMSQAQQDAFHQMRMEQIRQEEEFLKEQLLEHRRRYMEHERQLQEERRRRVSLQIQNEEGFGDISREIEPMAAHHVGQHPDSWTELRSLPDRSNVLPNSAIAVPSLPVQHQHQHQSSSEFYPSAWFEADSNVEGTRNNIDDSSIRYTPGNDGELNQKVSAKSSANAISSSAFGSQQGDGVPKKGKKPDADPWNPLQFKERESVFGNVEPHHLHHHPLQQSIEDGKTGDASGPGGPNEPTLDNVNVHLGDRPEGAPVQNAGMHLDDETMTFLSHLRFGGGLNTPDRSPTRGDRS
jgi:HMG-box domain